MFVRVIHVEKKHRYFRNGGLGNIHIQLLSRNARAFPSWEIPSWNFQLGFQNTLLPSGSWTCSPTFGTRNLYMRHINRSMLNMACTCVGTVYPTRSKWAGAKTEAKAPWRNWRRLEGRFGAWFDHMATRLLKSPLELQDCTCPTLKDQFKRNQKTTSFQVPIFKLPFLVAKQAGWTSPLWNPSPKLRVAKESSLWRHAPQIGHARAAFSQL